MNPWLARIPILFVLMFAGLQAMAQSVTGFNATPGVGQNVLYWDAFPSAIGYRIYWNTSPSPYPGGSVINTGTQNISYVHTGLSPSPTTTYYYRVVALVNPGPAESTPSTEIGISTVSGDYLAGGNGDGFSSGANCPTSLSGTVYPIQAINVIASAMPGQVSIYWNEVSGAVSYNVERSLTSGSGFTTLQSSLVNPTAMDQTAVAGTTYYYRITVNLAGGCSGVPSAEAVAIPHAQNFFNGGNGDGYASVAICPSKLNGIIYPIQATGVIASAMPGQVSVYWNEVSGAVSYNVERSLTSGSGFTTLLSNVTNPSAVDVAPTPGTTYYYRIQVNLSGGCSGVSSPEALATPVAQNFFNGGNGDGFGTIASCVLKLNGQSNAPGVSVITAASGPNQSSIYWNDLSGASAYGLEFSTTSNTGPWTSIYTGANLSFAHNGLAAGTTHYYRVVAALGGGCGASPSPVVTTLPSASDFFGGGNGDGFATVASCVLKLDGQSNAPGVSSVIVAAGSNQSSIYWNDLSGASGYVLEFSTTSNTGPWSQLYSGGNLSFFHNGITAGTTHYYRVVASLGGGCLASASPVSTTIPVASNFYGGGNGDGYAANTNCPGSLNGTNFLVTVQGLIAAPTPGGVSLYWNEVNSASSYIIEWTITSGSNYSTIGSGSLNTAFQHANPTPVIANFYRVTPQMGQGCLQAPSVEVYAKPVIQNYFGGGNGDGFAFESSCFSTKLEGTPFPQITALGPLNFCSGGDVTLVSTLSPSYIWSPGGQTTQTVLVSATGTYRVTIVNGFCTLTSPPVIVNAISNTSASLSGSQRICTGNTAQISINLTGVAPWDLTYNNGQSNVQVNGIAQTPYLINITPSQSVTYTAVSITSGCGTGTVSGQQSVSVESTPSASMSGTQNICSGGTTQLSVQMTGTPPWDMAYTDGQSIFTLFGLTSSPYVVNVTPLINRVYSPVSIFGACAGSVSGQTPVSVVAAPTATLTGNQAVCTGSPALLTVNFTGNPPWDIVYMDGFNQTTLIGLVTNPSILTPVPTGATTYSLVSVVSGCPGTVSGSAAVSLLPAPTASISGNNTILLGQTSVLTFALTGATPWTINYTDGTGSFTQTGINSSPYLVTITPTTTATYQLTGVNNNSCPGSTSGSAVVVVNSLPTAALSGSQTVCAGVLAQLTVNLGGPGPWTLTYTDGNTNTTVSGLNSSPYLFYVTPTNTTTYSLVSVTNPLTGTVSGTAIVGVTPLADVTLSGNNTIILGQTSPLNFSFTGTSPWGVTYSDGTNNHTVTGITSSPYQVTVTPTATVTYSLVSVNNICSGTLNGSAVIVVNVLPTAHLTGSQTLCSGTPAQLTVTLGGPGPWDLMWTDGTSNFTASGINTSPYLFSVTPLSSVTYSLISVNNPLSGTVSGLAALQVTAVPVMVTGLQSQNSACTSVQWIWNAIPGATAYYADASSNSNFTVFLPGWQNNLLGNTTSLAITGRPPGSTIYVRVRGNGVCGTSPDVAGVSGATLPLPTLAVSNGTSQLLCNGFTSNWQSSGNATGYELEVSQQSNFSVLESGYNPMVLSNVQSHGVTNLSNNTVYYWRVRGTNSCGAGGYSTGTMTRTVLLSDSVQVTSNTPVCSGGTLSFSSQSSYSGTGFTWSGPGGFTGSGTVVNRTNVNNTQGGLYTVSVSALGCNPYVQVVMTAVNDSAANIVRGGNTTLCSGETLTLTSSAQGSGLLYNWAGPNGYSSPGNTAQVNSISTLGGGIYTVTVSSAGCNTISDTISVTVTPTVPVTVSNSGPGCQGDAIYLSVSTVPGSPYNWSGPNGFNSNLQNPALTNVNLQNAGVYTVTVIQPGCNPLTYMTSVTVFPTNNNVVVQTNSPVCSGNTLGLSATQITGAVYSWIGPAGFTANTSTIQIPNSTVQHSGAYTLTVSNQQCQPRTDVVNIVVYPQLSQLSSGNNGPICAGNVLFLTSSSHSGAIYQWTGPNNFSSSTQNPSISNVTYSGNGVYSLSVSQPGCGTMSTTTTVSIGNPVSGVIVTNNSPACVGATLQFSATPVTGAVYSWTGPNGYTSNVANATHGPAVSNMAGPYLLTVSSAGCGSVNLTSRMNINAITGLGASNTSPVCSGDNLSLIGTGPRGGIFNWTGPNGFNSSLQNVAFNNATSNLSGVYTLVITDPGCGLVTLTTTVVVGSSMNGLQLSQNGPICAGSTLGLTGTVISGVNYVWSAPDGFTSSSNPLSRTNVPQIASGLWTLTASSTGCNPVVRSISVMVYPALSVQAGNNGPICTGSVLYLTSSSITGAVYQWNGPAGFISTVQNPSIINAQPVNAGTYTLQVTQSGCGVVSTSTSVVIGGTTGTVTAGSNTPVCAGTGLLMTASGVSGGTYSWSGPNGFTSSSQNPVIPGITVLGAGQYSLVVSSPGCGSTQRLMTVVVNPGPTLNAGSNGPICQGSVLYLTTNTITGSTYSWAGPNSYQATSQTGSISNAQPNRTGIYTLTVNTPGCGPISTTVSVQVGSNLNSITVASNSPVCAGNNLNLSATDRIGYSFVWSGPNGFASTLATPVISNATTAAAGNYIVTISSPGCGSLLRNLNNIQVNSSAQVTASGTTPVCAGAVIYLNGTGPTGTTYNWLGPVGFNKPGQNVNRIQSLVTHSGLYTLNATVPGCGLVSVTTAISVVACKNSDTNVWPDLSEATEEAGESSAIDGTDKGVSEVHQTLGNWILAVYPNPTEGKTQVRLKNQGEGAYRLEVLDVLGHIVLTPGRESIEGGERFWNLDFSSFPKGVYVVRVSGEAGGERMERVIVR